MGVNWKRLRIRQEKMLKNIQKLLIKDGKVIILTGVGHIPFFEKELKSKSPFR